MPYYKQYAELSATLISEFCWSISFNVHAYGSPVFDKQTGKLLMLADEWKFTSVGANLLTPLLGCWEEGEFNIESYSCLADWKQKYLATEGLELPGAALSTDDSQDHDTSTKSSAQSKPTKTGALDGSSENASAKIILMSPFSILLHVGLTLLLGFDMF